MIEIGTFLKCKNLKNIELPEGLEKIDFMAFRESGLQNVVFPKSLRTVSQEAFSYCENLKEATLNSGLEVLGTENKTEFAGVFGGSALERVELPSTLKRICNCAFASCKSLRYISLPNSLESIGALCFF